MAKSRWLRIQYVNHVFALTLRFKTRSPSEESRFELFVSFARQRHDFDKLRFSAQIVEQRIRFKRGIAEETAFNTAPQHSP